jgi:hypothetical protein
MSSFVVLTPSRGLVHSLTAEAVMANVDQAVAAGHEFRGWRLTHGLPIPDCHERVTEMGMATGAEYLFFVEEDMVPQPGSLPALIALQSKAPVTCIDYPVGWPKGWQVPDGAALWREATRGCWSCVNTPNGAGYLEWAPFGCTLIHRRVYEALSQPWYDVGKQTKVWHFGTRKTVTETIQEPYKYGGEDVEFGRRLIAEGFRIALVPDMLAGHALLKTWGPIQDNDGAHTVVVRDKIEWEWPR